MEEEGKNNDGTAAKYLFLVQRQQRRGWIVNKTVMYLYLSVYVVAISCKIVLNGCQLSRVYILSCVEFLLSGEYMRTVVGQEFGPYLSEWRHLPICAKHGIVLFIIHALPKWLVQN